MDNIEERERERKSESQPERGWYWPIPGGSNWKRVGRLNTHMKRSNRLSTEVLFMKHEGNGKTRITGFRPEQLAGWW